LLVRILRNSNSELEQCVVVKKLKLLSRDTSLISAMVEAGAVPLLIHLTNFAEAPELKEVAAAALMSIFMNSSHAHTPHQQQQLLMPLLSASGGLQGLFTAVVSATEAGAVHTLGSMANSPIRE
jgi:hypothetical protein